MGSRAIGSRCEPVELDSDAAASSTPDAGGPDAPRADASQTEPPGSADSGAEVPCADPGCADAQVIDPCASAACHADAACHVDNGQAVCTCNPGFAGDGLDCVRDECLAIDDDPTWRPCGPHAQCDDPSAELGDATCLCEAGHASCDGDADPNAGCETDTLTTPQHCGACDQACAGSLSCIDGSCEQTAAKLVLGGYDNSCALLEPADGRGARALRCWGGNHWNLLRTGSVDEPRLMPGPVAELAMVRSIAIGDSHACALSANSDVIACWGKNDYLQLGVNRTDVALTELVTATSVLRQVVELAAGWGHTCARDAVGKVHCWGSNYFGQLGTTPTGTFNGKHQPQEILAVQNAVQLVAGGYGACARTAAGGVICWGSGWSSPTVIADAIDRPLQDVHHISFGYNHGCALRASGEVGCWGPNSRGQLGTPPSEIRWYYQAVPGLSDVIDVAAAYEHTCALVAGGQVYCWGANDYLAIDSTDPVSGPLPVRMLSDAIDIEASGAGKHTCARRRTGQVVCWGENLNGQLGDGTAITPTAPVNVEGLP